MESNKICKVTGRLFSEKISVASNKAWNYLNKSIEFFNNGNCIKADYKRAVDCLNLSYEMTRHALMQELLQSPMRERDNEKWNNLYWTSPHYVHQWNQKCTNLYNKEYSNYVEIILHLKQRKSNMKLIWESK